MQQETELVFWNGAVDAIEQLLELILDRLSSDVTLSGGAREGPALDDHDVFRGSDALVDIAARVKLPRSPDDLLLELLSVHRAPLRRLDEQGRRRSPVADDDALENELATGRPDVVLDRPELIDDKRLGTDVACGCADLLGIAPETVLALDPIIFPTPRKVLSRFNLEEQITGVKVSVRLPQRDVGTIERLGKDDELQ
jgi:hypothetical protein